MTFLGPPKDIPETGREVSDAYRDGADRPLGSYLGVMATYGAAVGAASLLAKRRGGFPDHLRAADVALLTTATFELSRLLAKAPVTSPLRAPFTRYQGTSGEAELREEVRGSGIRKAVGELVTCPFCLGSWTATSLAFGFVLAPRPTRLAATVLSAVAGASTLQLLYDKLQPGD